MSFNIALSGIRAASQDLAVTGNNIANASTTGFKESRTEFGDIYASSLGSSGSSAVGSGVRVQDISQQFAQGNVSFTDNLLDLAIDGSGFFVLNNNGEQSFTRAGAFGIDEDGFIVNNSNARLQGFSVDDNGNINNIAGDIEISSSNLQPETTSQVNTEVGLDASEAPPQLAFTIPSARIAGIDTAGATITITNPQGVATDLVLSTSAATGDDTAASISTLLNNALGLDSQVNAAGDVELVLDEGFTITANPTIAGSPALNISTTTAVGIGFDPLDSSTFNHTTATTIFDSLGNSHILRQFFIRQPFDPSNSPPTVPNSWQVVVQIDGQNVGAPTDPLDPVGTATLSVHDLFFTPNGALNEIASDDIDIVNWTPLNASGDPIGAIGPLPAGAPVGTESSNINISLSGSTHRADNFEERATSQDGTATGRLAGLSLSDDGSIFARFTNGENRILAQVALADFANVQGLEAIGNTSFVETFESGAALIGRPETASLGSIESGALEESNVDLSEQLVNLIIAQRNFQANAQTVETADTVTQTIINI